MVSDHSLPPSNSHSPAPKFCNNNSFTTRIFSDVAGDITIVVDGESFLLHKFPLVAWSGKIRKLVATTNDTRSLSTLELGGLPGGPHTFGLAMKFCYGMNFQITTSNVADLHCAAQFLEMTEEFREDNLVSRTETYLNEVVFQSLDKTVEVLKGSESLLPLAEEVGIMVRCVDAIAFNACKEQLVSSLSRLECDDHAIMSKLKGSFLDWWVEDLSTLGIDSYKRVICAMGRLGVRSDSIVTSLMHYAQSAVKGLGFGQVRTRPNPMLGDKEQRTVVEALVSLLPSEKSSSVQLSFLFGMLRMAITVDASLACRLELERRIASRLEMVSLDELLIPSLRPGDSLFDTDMVHRILVSYLQRVELEEEEEEEEEEENEQHSSSGYESDVLGCPGHGSLLKVGCLIDAYLAEIAPDPYLTLHKFSAMIEILPDYARVIDDALYRAIDIYLKAHPMLTEHECKKLCKFIDCQKLSQEARNHAAQNDRLPLPTTVRVLYFEQIRLKTALSGSSGDGFFSLNNKMGSGIPSAAMSPRDNYASLRRENRELKLEISRMRVRLSEIEKEQTFMKQGMMGKARNGKTLLNSISRGIGRIGIFGGGQTKRHKSGRKSRGSEGKTGRSRRYSSVF